MTLLMLYNLRKVAVSYVYAIFVWHVAYLCMSPLYFQKGEDRYEDVVGMRNCKRVE